MRLAIVAGPKGRAAPGSACASAILGRSLKGCGQGSAGSRLLSGAEGAALRIPLPWLLSVVMGRIFLHS
ncbi:MAG: hypothetical protein N2110_01955 [Flavobacteriales bacterium]|nr:hypothetical protein [Flavobacteriales bacterium]